MLKAGYEANKAEEAIEPGPLGGMKICGSRGSEEAAQGRDKAWKDEQVRLSVMPVLNSRTCFLKYFRKAVESYLPIIIIASGLLLPIYQPIAAPDLIDLFPILEG